MARRPLNLTRDQLASFLKDPEQIKQFENLFASARNPQILGGSAGSIPYQSGDSETTLLPIGTPGQLLQVNPTADAPEWGAYTGTGDVVRATDPALTNPTITNGRATGLDYVGFDNTPTIGAITPGDVYWDDGNGTLNLNLKGGNVDCLIGEQEYARVFNDTATTLSKGQVVYISGAQGNRVAVKLAQADSDANSAHTIGLVAETIAAGGEGWVQISGPMYKLNTFGTIAGETVYLSPTTPGLWTTTKPVAPNHLVILGFIERVNATVGSIFIKVDNGYELDELHNVKITSVTNADILQYDSTGPFWKNQPIGSISVGSATNLAGGAAGSLPYQSGAGATTFLSIGAANRVLTSSGTGPQWSNSLSGLASIVSTGNITGTSLTIHPTLNGKIGANTAWIGENSTATVAIGMYQAGSGFTNIANVNFISSGSTIRGVISCTEESGGDAAYLAFSTRSAAGSVGERLRITSTGNVGIGKTNPSTILDVNGTATATTFSGSGALLTNLPAGQLTGTIPSSVLGNSVLFIGTTSIALNRSSASISLTGVNIDGSAGSAATATKATNLAGGNNTTLLGAIGYQSNTDTTTLLSPNVTTNKQFLSQTGTGTNGAAPVWSAVSKSDVGLGNVENTALSTWAGSANITTVGTIATGTWNATTISIAKGGTGQTTAVAAFDALSPATTLGDLIYSDGTDNVRLPGNTTASRRFLRQTGTGTVSAAPAWDALTDADIPAALTGKTYNALTLTASATGFTVAGGTSSKTLTVSNTLTLAGTDGSTLNVGAGGTLGSAAYTASTAYAPAAGSASVTTLGTIATGTWNATAIGAAYGGTGQTSYAIGDILYASGTTALAKLAGVATGNALISGGVGTAPSWGKIGLATHVSGTLAVANGGTNVSATPTNGQLLIGNGSGYSLANITGTANQVSVTNSAGGITLSLPQNINSGATPSFAGMTVTGNSLLGYGTGSGGAVTQTTSRTTGVTINKTNGAITLVSASGTTAWQSFTVTNSTVSASDTVIVSQKSGADLYMIYVTKVSAGSFQLTFATTGGTTTEQPVFNFAVIKAVTT